MIEANQTKSSFICYHWKPPSAYRNQLPFQKPSQIFGNKFSTSRPRWSVISYDSWASVLDWSHMGANPVFSFSVIGCFRKPQRFLRITSLVYQREMLSMPISHQKHSITICWLHNSRIMWRRWNNILASRQQVK